jgi:beta-galactosidase
LREALWSEKPMVRVAVRASRGGRGGRGGGGAVESHWNWENDSRERLPVDVFSNGDSVELFLNGTALGRKTTAEATNAIFQWQVPFKAGEVKAIAVRGGQRVEHRLITAGKPARIELISDRTRLSADGRDVAHIELRLVDERGVLVPNGDALCSVQVSGAGRLLGVDNGDQRDMTALTLSSRKLNRGRALAIVQSGRRSGRIEVLVSAPGFPERRLRLRAE